ncbi:hypothetical protein GGR51DRAFT_475168 [Nemania sp. FL0031]|nr:hypothetical protein GGR51DRAFT_475168 [Nemania sp. FL0031]
MDPVTAIGVAGSVFGIVGFGIQLSELLSKYVTLARSAQEQLEDIADQIDLTAVVLNEIFAFLKREVDNNRLGRPLYLFTTESLLQIKETAVQCVVIFWRVEAAIFGNPAHLEKELPKKIVRFMNAFAQNSLDLSIQIKLKVTLDDLDDLNWRQKFRWPSKASKLDRFCEQLHRYERALTLLIQIVSLGQQRLKRNPNEKDIQFRQKTEEEIIHIIIASETQTQNHSWHANTKSEPSIPNHIKPARIPSWAATSSLPTKGFSTNLGPHSLRSAQSRNPLSPQSKDMSTSVRIPSSGLPQPPDGATFNSQTDTSVCHTSRQLGQSNEV